MKVAVIGSRGLNVDIAKYIPKNADAILSGGAKGIDSLAEAYADKHRISKLIIRPDYARYGKRAPLIRNKSIVNKSDVVIAVWDGISRGTKFTVDYSKSIRKPTYVFVISDNKDSI